MRNGAREEEKNLRSPAADGVVMGVAGDRSSSVASWKRLWVINLRPTIEKYKGAQLTDTVYKNRIILKRIVCI